MKKPLLLALLATVIGAGCFFSLVHFGVFWSPTVVTTVTCRNASPPPESVDLGIQPHDDCTPSFTEQDVRAYFRPGFGMHGMQVNNITFTRILFTTGADARRLMGSDSIGASDSAIVCYVEMRGTVSGHAGILEGSPVPGDHPRESTLRVIFDAHSGELLSDELS